MTNRKRLVLDFPTPDAAREFVGWYLDGGGEQEFASFCEMHAAPAALAATPDGRAQWDWGDPDRVDGDWTIRMVES